MSHNDKNERDGDWFDEASSGRLSDVDMASESLLPHMFQEHTKGRRPWQKQHRLCWPFLWLLAGAGLGALVPWLIGLHQSRRDQDHGFHFVPQTDPIGFFPQISHKIQYFEKTSEYISNHSSPESLQEVKKLWEKLIPRQYWYLPLCLVKLRRSCFKANNKLHNKQPGKDSSTSQMTKQPNMTSLH